MNHTWKALSASIILLVCNGAAAHHSFSMFDNAKDLTLAGEIRDFQWTNPHSWIFLLVTDQKGAPIEWKVEGGSPNLLRRDGWTRRSLAKGDKVTLIIHPAKDGSNFGSLVRVTLADGTKLGSR